MIHYYHIYVDIYPYMGESEEVEKCDYGGGGWHVSNHIERNKLLFGKVLEKPKLITGETCLRSELNRIIDRAKSGMNIGLGIKIYPVDENGYYSGEEKLSYDKNRRSRNCNDKTP